MLAEYLKRGLVAGLVGGLAYGGFVALVGNSLVAHAESLESSGAAEQSLAAGGPELVGIVAAVLWGALLGLVVLGLAYYFLEPMVPGRQDTRGYLLAGAGFVTVSGAPWLVLPPQPPGVEQAAPTEWRLAWYAGMAVLGAAVCLAGFAVANRLRDRSVAVAGVVGLAPLLLLAVPALLAPSTPTTGPIPDAFAAGFRWTTVFGQVLLWAVAAAAFAWLERRVDPRGA